MKFGDKLPSRLGDIILNKIDDRRGPMDDGHHRITIAHLEPMSQAGELKSYA